MSQYDRQPAPVMGLPVHSTVTGIPVLSHNSRVKNRNNTNKNKKRNKN